MRSKGKASIEQVRLNSKQRRLCPSIIPGDVELIEGRSPHEDQLFKVRLVCVNILRHLN
jgi:hypothetical protein